MYIIGVGHRKLSGKDTFAKDVIEILKTEIQTKNLKIGRIGFADKLYDFCYSVYKWAGFKDRIHYINFPHDKGRILPLLNKTPRQILIEIGNHMRTYDESIWLNAALKTKDFDVLIVTDVRYPNEAQSILDNNGTLIKIDRTVEGVDYTDVADMGLANWETWTHVINNNGSRQEFYKNNERFVKGNIIVRLNKVSNS